MRTTLNIEDDVLAVAKGLAVNQRKSVGAIISALVSQALRPLPGHSETRNGVPLLPVRADALPVTSELVKQLRDEPLK